MSLLVWPKTQAILAQAVGKWSTLTSSLSCNYSFQLSKVGLVPSISNKGFVIFIDRNGIVGVFGALLRYYDKAIKTIASLQVSNYGLLSPDTGVFLVSNSSYNHLILALIVASSAQGFKTMIISLFKVLEGLARALLVIVFQ